VEMLVTAGLIRVDTCRPHPQGRHRTKQQKSTHHGTNVDL
jgi:hypothetical protein